MFFLLDAMHTGAGDIYCIIPWVLQILVIAGGLYFSL